MTSAPMATHMLLTGNMKCDEINKAILANSISIENMLNSSLQRPGGLSSAIYDMRRHRAGEARSGFEIARFAYDAHFGMHHCEPTRP